MTQEEFEKVMNEMYVEGDESPTLEEYLKAAYHSPIETEPVDLEKEMDKYYGMYRDKTGKTYDVEDNEPCFDWKEDETSECEMRIARHFYELGRKGGKV